VPDSKHLIFTTTVQTLTILNKLFMKKIYDVAIIGGGMAGLSAAINAAAEGLTTVILEHSPRFPKGVSGEQLTQLSVAQARKFGTEFINPFNVDDITRDADGLVISGNHDDVHARSVIVASGMSWKTIEAKNISRFVGSGVSYGSPSVAENYSGKTIVIAGGANSAGQAAMFLSECTDCNIILLIRNSSTTGTMSHYLAERVLSQKNITICTDAEILEGTGDLVLEKLKVKCGGEETTFDVDKLYILIGGKPNTSWIHNDFKDKDGHLVTGFGGLTYQTEMDGLFAVGDVRSRSVRRVSNAVGEGASVVNDIRTYLQQLKQSQVLA
jgi:thioredoxin reductase (NADPH)